MVKTRPFHGRNMGSNPVRVTYGGLAQLGEHLPYKQEVTGSSPVSSIVRDYRRCGSLFLCKKNEQAKIIILSVQVLRGFTIVSEDAL